MKLLLSCREVQTLATDFQEGNLPFTRRLAVRIHLLLCWACRAFLRGLRALPALSRKALAPETRPPQAALDALEATLKALRR